MFNFRNVLFSATALSVIIMSGALATDKSEQGLNSQQEERLSQRLALNQGSDGEQKLTATIRPNGFLGSPKDKAPNPRVNKGWDQTHPAIIDLYSMSSQNIQKNENIIVEPSLKTTSQRAGEAQKTPEVISTNGFLSSSQDKAPNPRVNKGWDQTHPAIIDLYSMSSQIIPQDESKYSFTNQNREEQRKIIYQGKGKIISVTNSSEEESENSSITITNTSSQDDFIESSEECSIESSEDDYWIKLPKKGYFKRLKKKNQIKHEDSRTSIDSDSYSIDSDFSSEDEASPPSIDENYEPSWRGHESVVPPIVTTRSSNKTSKRKNSSSASFTTAVESEEEDDFSDRFIPSAENDEDFDLVTTMGTRLKLLANVYLANLEGKANIFLPRYTLEVEHPEGTFEIKSFFETSKGEICVFASGGLHHIWEKNIEHIYNLFFGQKVKIIRSHWMQNHLQNDTGIEINLEEEFYGKEHELHSEFYYDLFFRHYFIQELAEFTEEEEVRLKRLTIHAFSWWDVCNDCEGLLSQHKPPVETELELSYKIAARKRYNHAYPHTSIVEDYALPKTVEEKAWKEIWDALSQYTSKSFVNRKEKEFFWTKTKDGLEVCKWLGQAFRERTKGLAGKAKPAKKGDVLAFYRTMQPEKTKALEDLLSYLQDKNWDLSCWYWGPNFPSGTQAKWKRHWKQQIVPHFGWEDVNDYRIEESSDHCEMCGQTDLMNVHLVFHPKFHVSNKFLNLPEEDQKLRERDYGFTFESPISDFPDALKQKRRQCLNVGSDCIQYLCFSKENIEEWRENHPDAEANTKWELDRLAAYDALDVAEKNLKGSEKKRRKK